MPIDVYIKFGDNGPNSFRRDVAWKWRRTKDDRQWMPAYAISSPVNFRLRWAKIPADQYKMCIKPFLFSYFREWVPPIMSFLFCLWAEIRTVTCWDKKKNILKAATLITKKKKENKHRARTPAHLTLPWHVEMPKSLCLQKYEAGPIYFEGPKRLLSKSVGGMSVFKIKCQNILSMNCFIVCYLQHSKIKVSYVNYLWGWGCKYGP